MKSLILYIILFLPFYIQAQVENPLNDIEKDEGTYCFREHSLNPNYKSEDSTRFIIRIIPPILDSTITSITYSNIDTSKIINKRISILIRPSYSEYTRHIKYEESCFESITTYCVTKYTWNPILKKIHIDSLRKQDYTFHKISLIQDGNIEKEYIEKAPNIITKNERYFHLSAWSNFRWTCCTLTTHPSFEDIEKALKEKGYTVIINNEVDEIDKHSLTQFQIKNKLPHPGINLETFRALGLIY